MQDFSRQVGGPDLTVNRENARALARWVTDVLMPSLKATPARGMAFWAAMDAEEQRYLAWWLAEARGLRRKDVSQVAFLQHVADPRALGLVARGLRAAAAVEVPRR